MSTRRLLILSGALAALLLLAARMLTMFVSWTHRDVDPGTTAVSRARAHLAMTGALPSRPSQVWIMPQPGFRYVMFPFGSSDSRPPATVRVYDDGRCEYVDPGR